KFTDRGQVEVVVRVGERDGRDVQLLVEVRDTGIGMSDEQSARLFQAFTQVDGSATRKYGGTGLGLTISKRLVDLMGGEIHVRSVQGRGSTFTFTLRLKIDEQGGAAQRVLPDALNGMRMLIVDDNAAARDILSEQLRALRFDVVAVESGETALRAVRDEDRARPFGALMLDWKMPGLDGIEVARLVRTGTHLRQVPRMILVTAFAAETVRTQAEAAGIEAFLSKPVSRSALVDTLVELFVPKDGVLVQSGTSSLASRVDLGGVRLLLVEDNEINRQIAVELLQLAGARVDTANNGQEALDRLLVAGPKAWQMVLMDVQMPVMDGLEATRRIRMDRRFDDVPIIAMTAHAMVEERRRCTEAGMVDHISKPIDPDSMMRTIAQRLGIAPVPYVAAPVAKSAGVEFPVIEGLDSIAGLQRVGGDSKLYRGLLLMFAERQTHAVEQVQASLVTGNTAAAEQLVHSVRGAAGNLGFVGLFDAASAFELAIRNGDDTVAVAGLFAQRLNDAITAIDTTLREPASEPADDAAPPEDMSARVGELATLLEDSDGQVLDFAAANPAVIRALFAGPAAVEFDKAIRNFDFDHALAMLKDAAETGGVPLDGA
ncbi:MAG: response regulator, partial [Burkholderiales bacterium]|nr:response regulator [Burkholderiales bacterium]